MRPNFGCGIHELVFDRGRQHGDPADPLGRRGSAAPLRGAHRRARRDGRRGRRRAQGKLLVEIEYRVRKTNQTGNLVFPFYFREGGRP